MKQQVKLYTKLINPQTKKAEVYQLKLVTLVAKMCGLQPINDMIDEDEFCLPLANGFSISEATFKIAGCDGIMYWQEYPCVPIEKRILHLKYIHTTIEGAVSESTEDLAFPPTSHYATRYDLSKMFNLSDIEKPSEFRWYQHTAFKGSPLFSLKTWFWSGTEAKRKKMAYSGDIIKQPNSNSYPLYDFISDTWYYDKTTKYYATELECYKDNHVAVHVFKDEDDE